MTRPPLSIATEDYLKTIFLVQDEGEPVTTVGLAARLNVAAPSVTHMVKRLHEMGLVIHSPYHGIELTPAGRAVALEVVRHHRLIELYLARFLDVPWDKVHEEAEHLEHVLSEDIERRMDQKLGAPAVDPHGHPIPSHTGNLPDEPTMPLWNAPEQSRVVVARVSDRDPAFLAHLATLSLVPGVVVEIVDVSPFNGTETIRIGDATHVIGSDLARNIQVRAQAREGSPS